MKGHDTTTCMLTITDLSKKMAQTQWNAEMIDPRIGVVSGLQEDNGPTQSSTTSFVPAAHRNSIFDRCSKLARQQQQRQYSHNSFVHCRYHFLQSLLFLFHAYHTTQYHWIIAIVCLDCCDALLLLLAFVIISRYKIDGT